MNFQESLTQNGFSILEAIFTTEEIDVLRREITLFDNKNHHIRGQESIFAIRCFLQEIPHLRHFILNDRLKEILKEIHPNYSLVKSIYFNKPPKANWIVNWHQDLTISVKQKVNSNEFKNWTDKGDYFAVQPPIAYLKDMLTIRIHLDNCTIQNGALRVISQSHQEILHFKETNSSFFEKETVCEVGKGGVLLMKPLLWHSSKRTENQENRRVIHLEFCTLDLPKEMEWQEKYALIE